MFTTSSERYYYHINNAKQIRARVSMLKRILADRIAKNKPVELRVIIEIAIANAINDHHMALVAAKIERNTTHYKTL